jgi:hypothetical protein
MHCYREYARRGSLHHTSSLNHPHRSFANVRIPSHLWRHCCTQAVIIKHVRFTAELNLMASLLGQSLLRADCEIGELPMTMRTDLANRLLPQLDTLKDLWLLDNRCVFRCGKVQGWMAGFRVGGRVHG